MNFGDSVKSGFNRYFDFSTRSSRSEYWWWVLFNTIAGYASIFLSGAIVNMGIDAGALLVFVYYIATLIPTIAVAVRRLHDTDRSGWWLLIAIVPFIGWILLIIWYVSRGTDGDNQYGANPLGVEE